MTGFIHSLETLGTLDGPGLRTVVFLQGCPLRCIFCHNVDSTLPARGTSYEVEDLIQKILKNKPYWKKNQHSSSSTKGRSTPESIAAAQISDPQIPGGVTISGGDPLFQPKFLQAIVQRLHQEKIHIAVESSLFTQPGIIDSLLPFVDLWMVSIKHLNNQRHQELTGQPNELILSNLRYLDQQICQKQTDSTETTKNEEDSKSKNSWPCQIRVRFVVIPGHTDDQKHIQQLGKFVSSLQNLEVLELLPYVTLGKHKWLELFGKYQLEGVPEATLQDVKRVEKWLQPYNLRLKY